MADPFVVPLQPYFMNIISGIKVANNYILLVRLVVGKVAYDKIQTFDLRCLWSVALQSKFELIARDQRSWVHKIQNFQTVMLVHRNGKQNLQKVHIQVCGSLKTQWNHRSQG